MKKKIDVIEVRKCKDIPLREYVRKLRTCEKCNGKGEYHVFGTENKTACDCFNGYTMQGKTYIRGDYVRENKKYSLIDADDMNREVFISGDTRLMVGFTY